MPPKARLVIPPERLNHPVHSVSTASVLMPVFPLRVMLTCHLYQRLTKQTE